MHWLLLAFLWWGSLNAEVMTDWDSRATDSQDGTLYGGTGFPPTTAGQEQPTTLYGGTGFPPIP